MTTPKQQKRQRGLLTAGYNDFEKGLSRYAFMRTHNKALSQDLIQNTFHKTWKYMVKGGDIVVMEAFLYHILKALIIDEYRKKKPVSLDLLLEKGFEPHIDETIRIQEIYDGKQIALLISDLPVLYQKVMRMRYLQDMSLKEIALITGQSRNTVAVQSCRGLEKLKVLYAEHASMKM